MEVAAHGVAQGLGQQLAGLGGARQQDALAVHWVLGERVDQSWRKGREVLVEPGGIRIGSRREQHPVGTEVVRQELGSDPGPSGRRNAQHPTAPQVAIERPGFDRLGVPAVRRLEDLDALAE